ncbi:putative ribonuclease H-like domain-containing protein [Tanacetum coccineum]
MLPFSNGHVRAMASKQFNLGHGPQLLTPGTISSGLVPNPSSPTPYVLQIKKDWDTLFQPMFDEYFNPPPSVVSPVLATAAPRPADPTSTPSSTIIDQDAPSPSTSQTHQETQSPVIPSGVEEHFHNIEVAHLDNDPFFGVPIPELNYEESSSRDVIRTNVYSVNQPPEHLRNVIGNCVMIITLKWIFKVKLDELGGDLKNNDWLVVRGYRQEEGVDFEESFALTAFLNGILCKEVYVSQPDGFVDQDNHNNVYKLKKDLYGLKQTLRACPIPTTRIHKDDPFDQVIGDLKSATQTRNMSKNLKEHRFEEPKKVIHALKVPSWIEAMQEELLQFKLQEVWTLVNLSNGKRVIGSKWVFRNKKDKRGIVIRNKARLVAQGYTQEEGIGYYEVFAPVARIEAIRLFLAYASFKDFVVYQMDVKSAFLYEKIEEEVYVCQPPGFEDPDFPDRVYKMELCIAFGKLMNEKFQMSSMGELTFFLGLQVKQKKDDIFISQDKYVDEILKKFGFTEVKTASTPMETYQVNPKVSYLHAVKRIFRYLKGQPKLGLRYPKDSPFDLVAYTDSDYARASLDRKCLTGGCQFLGCRLISWQCKKQTVVANSTTEAEYVAASSCYGTYLYLILLGKAKKNVKLMMEKLLKMELELILCLSLKTTAWNEFSSTMASAIICLAANQKFNFSKFIFESMIRNLDNLSGKFLMYPRLVWGLLFFATSTSSFEADRTGRLTLIDPYNWETPNESSSLVTTSGGGLRCQETIGDTIAQTRLKLDDLMELCTTLPKQVLDLENDKEPSNIMRLLFLKRRVKKLEKKNRSRTHKLKRLYKVGLTARVESSDNEESLGEDASKQGRIDAIDADEEITLYLYYDHQLAERMHAQEQEELSIEEKATLFQQLLEKRRKHFAAKRAEEKRNKPPTKSQQRKIMCTYLKNMEGYKLKDLKLKEFDSIQEMFNRAFKRVNTFEYFRIELVEGKEKRAGTELV